MMKKALIFFAVILIAQAANGQINAPRRQIAEKEKPSYGRMPYDSSRNTPSKEEDYASYIKQTIFIEEGCNDEKFKWYRGEYLVIDSVYTTNTVWGIRDRLILRRTKEPYSSFLYDTLLDLEYHPWITVSYYNYLRSRIGDRFYCHDKQYRDINGHLEYAYCLNPYDINSGKEILFPKKSLWTLSDINTDTDSGNLIAIFTNLHGETTYCRLQDFGKRRDGQYLLLPEKEYNRLVKKYGRYFVDRTFDGTAEIGMPKELFILIFGEPTEINDSSYQEQWVYSTGISTTYYYFRNGKFVDWDE